MPQQDEITRPLKVIRDYRDLHNFVRARLLEQQLTGEECDERGDFAPRYTSKIMAPTMMKTLGQKSFGAMLTILNIDLIAVERKPHKT